jgi:hypothetical protein
MVTYPVAGETKATSPDPPLVSGRKVGFTASFATSRASTVSGARLSTEG